ncbi:MAG: CvpA family protein [Pseudomonadota bacterium]
MDSFTLIDGIVAALIVVSALLAYSRGLLREVMSIAGWVAAAVIAFLFFEPAIPLVSQLPYADRIIGSSCELGVVAGFGAVFIVALIVVSIFTPLLSSLIQRSFLGAVDQALGFLFGVARGVLLVAIAFFIYDTIITSQDMPMVEQSRSAAVFSRFSDDIGQQEPTAALEWLNQQYETVLSSCDS